MDYFQMIPILALTIYIIYLSYYYAAPMFCLKVLLFYAHIRYREIDIRFTDGKITVTLGETVYQRELDDMDPTSRFFASAVCAEFRRMLREIRKGVPVESEEAEN